MIYHKLIVKLISVCLCILSVFGAQFSTSANYTKQPSLVLWILATDENSMNSKLVAFEITKQQIVDEVVLPSDYLVMSARWSPNMEYIAAIIGEKIDASTYGKAICIFAATGETKWCQEFSILSVGGFKPASIDWSSDSQFLAIVTSIGSNRSLQRAARVTIINLERSPADLSVTVNFEDIVIDEWMWLQDGIAAIRGWNRARQSSQLYAVKLTPQPEYFLVASDVGPALATSHNTILYGKLADLPDEAPLEMATIDDGGHLFIQPLGQPQFDNTLLSAAELAFSREEKLVALVATEATTFQKALYVLDVDANAVSKIKAIDFVMDQLMWSPDSAYIAARVCSGPGLNNQCRVEIFTMEGEQIRVDTGYPENRDPMWPING